VGSVGFNPPPRGDISRESPFFLIRSASYRKLCNSGIWWCIK